MLGRTTTANSLRDDLSGRLGPVREHLGKGAVAGFLRVAGDGGGDVDY
jgi:hypothetical protein